MITNTIKEIIGAERRVISYSSPDDPFIKRVVINSIELITGRRKVEKAYNQLKLSGVRDARVWDQMFPLLELQLSYDSALLEGIPKEGPVVVVANHPFGVADGLSLGHFMSKRREDFKIIVNEVLCREEILGKFLLPIDFRDTKEALRMNINTRNIAMEMLSKGGAIAIFPSGGVSTAPTPFSKEVVDLDWKNFLYKIVKTTSAPVVPIFFHGRNSQLFQIASHVNANFRLGLLLSELNNKRGKTLKVNIGAPISNEELRGMKPVELIAYLRNKTMDLGKHPIAIEL